MLDLGQKALFSSGVVQDEQMTYPFPESSSPYPVITKSYARRLYAKNLLSIRTKLEGAGFIFDSESSRDAKMDAALMTVLAVSSKMGAKDPYDLLFFTAACAFLSSSVKELPGSPETFTSEDLLERLHAAITDFVEVEASKAVGD